MEMQNVQKIDPPQTTTMEVETLPIENESFKLNCRNFRNFVVRLNEDFSREFVVFLLNVYFFLKGFTSHFIYLCQLPFYKKKLNVSGRQYQIFTQIAFTPYAVKPLIGAISDLKPLFGYHKRSYMLIFSCLGSIAMILMSIVQFSKDNAYIASILCFLVISEVAFVDLLCEGKYTEIMIKNGGTNSDVVT